MYSPSHFPERLGGGGFAGTLAGALADASPDFAGTVETSMETPPGSSFLGSVAGVSWVWPPDCCPAAELFGAPVDSNAEGLFGAAFAGRETRERFGALFTAALRRSNQ